MRMHGSLSLKQCYTLIRTIFIFAICFVFCASCIEPGSSLAAGFIMWVYERNIIRIGAPLPLLDSYSESRSNKYADVSKDEVEELRHILQRKIIDVSKDEVEELRHLLQRKIIDLKEAGILLDMGQQRMCTAKEEMLSLCIDTNCTRPLPPTTSRENIQSVRKPVHEIGLDKLREVIKAFDVNPQKKKYVFITGASSNHFVESQAVIESFTKTVLPHLTNYSFIYYDLGLNERERQLVRDFSGAELRTFPFDKLPPHVRQLMCYSWKPLIVLAHLQNSEFLVWMDASIFFKKDIHPYFNKVSKTGFLIKNNSSQMPQHTYLKMFSYFGDQPCQFSTYPEIEAGFMVLHNEPFTRRLIIEPWSACALDPNCMCPEESRKMLSCHIQKRQYGKCHRFDQATFGYITIKVLRDNRQSNLINNTLSCHVVRQGQRGSYLVDLEKAKSAKSATKT